MSVGSALVLGFGVGLALGMSLRGLLDFGDRRAHAAPPKVRIVAEDPGGAELMARINRHRREQGRPPL